MSNVQRLAIVDPNDTTRESIKNLLLGLDTVWLEAECSRYEFFSDVAGQTNPEIGIVALDSDSAKAVQLIAELRETCPDCNVLALSASSDGELILQAIRAGAREFLTLPVRVEEFLNALDRISSQARGLKQGKSRRCTVVAVAGAAGGVGTTSLAVNLGCVFAGNPHNSVALVDLDLSLGDVDVFLDVIPDYTLVDVAQNITRLDYGLLKRSLAKHSSGLYLLPRPVQLQESSLIAADDVQRMLGLLKATFSHLIVDISKSFSAVDIVALDMADHVLLVSQLDLPCLRNVVRLMMSFEEYEGLKEKTKIIVNRVGLDNGQIGLKKAQETIGRDIFWQLPNDYRVMVDVRNNGVPLIEQAPRASITQSIVGLAEGLDPGSTDLAVQEGKRGLGRWLTRGSKERSAGPRDEGSAARQHAES